MMMSQITGDVIRKVFAVQLAPGDSFARWDERELDESDYELNLDADGELVNRGGFPGAPSGPGGLPQQSEEGYPLMDQRQMAAAYGGMNGESPMIKPVVSGEAKVGRNDPCPCGSGKKYKKCHGA